MRVYKYSCMVLTVAFIFMALLVSPASAQLKAFVVEDNSNIHCQYDYTALSASYSIWQSNQTIATGNLYKDFAAISSRIRAIQNSKGEYVSYADVQAAYSLAQTHNVAFDVHTYVETAPLYTAMPTSYMVVSTDALNSVIRTASYLNPKASAFSIGGGTGVTTVNGTVVGNEITFTVVPDATYTTASVTVSDNVYVTVTKAGDATPARTDINVEKGVLTTDVGMLGAFNLSQTSATGAELIAKTPTGSAITVLIKNQADQTKTTTYTVKFVSAQ